jgi:hypothetical protein
MENEIRDRVAIRCIAWLGCMDGKLHNRDLLLSP